MNMPTELKMEIEARIAGEEGNPVEYDAKR